MSKQLKPFFSHIFYFNEQFHFINRSVAHGFAVEEGWEALSPDKPLVMMKLVDVTEVVGLKSPG